MSSDVDAVGSNVQDLEALAEQLVSSVDSDARFRVQCVSLDATTSELIVTVSYDEPSRSSSGAEVEPEVPAANSPHRGSGPWTKEKNARRCDLIDKEIEGTISGEEQSELETLQREACEHLDRVAPLPIEGARELHRQLLAKKRRHEARE